MSVGLFHINMCNIAHNSTSILYDRSIIDRIQTVTAASRQENQGAGDRP